MKTLFRKIWDAHVVAHDEGAPALLYVDLHLVHEVTSPQAFESLRANGRPVRRPDQHLHAAGGRQADHPRRLEAIDHRERVVQQDEVRAELHRQLHGLLPILSQTDDLERRLGQPLPPLVPLPRLMAPQ